MLAPFPCYNVYQYNRKSDEDIKITNRAAPVQRKKGHLGYHHFTTCVHLRMQCSSENYKFITHNVIVRLLQRNFNIMTKSYSDEIYYMHTF